MIVELHEVQVLAQAEAVSEFRFLAELDVLGGRHEGKRGDLRTYQLESPEADILPCW